VTSGAVSSGSGVVDYSVDVNEGPDRTGTLTIAGHQVTVSQNQGCWFRVDPASQRFGASGGNGSVAVTGSDPLCPWSATSNVDWITITSEVNGAGSAILTYSVAPIKKKKRTGTLTISSATLSVSQSRN